MKGIWTFCKIYRCSPWRIPS